MTYRRAIVVFLIAAAAPACATTHIVNGRRVDENALQSPSIGTRQSVVAPGHRTPQPPRPRPTAQKPPAALRTVPRSRLRRFARHGEDVVSAWRYGAIGDQRLTGYLDQAEADATDDGRKVLQTGRAIVMNNRVIRGSCWTFANAVYKRAGINRRRSVHKGKKDGPYVDADVLRPGDFLSYINHSHHGGVHSAIFVGWLDMDRREALMLSYVGGRKRKPGGYRSYLLSHVYRVQRSREDAENMRF